MKFSAYCQSLGIILKETDINLINWRLRMIDSAKHQAFLDEYVTKWLDEVKKQPKNEAAHLMARAKVTYWVKNYKRK